MSILFWQKKQWEHCLWLQNHNTLPHALLFEGSKGLGKLQFAHYFSGWLFCQSPHKIDNQAPCQVCQSCVWMATKTHPEYFYIAPLDDSAVITIDQIRELTTIMQLTPQYAQKRCIIIDQAHTLNGPASNALLKILEEPTQTTLFIVITAYKQRLKPTILSRLTSVVFSIPDEKQVHVAYPDVPLWALRMAQGAPLAACELATPEYIKIRLHCIEGLSTLSTKTGDPLAIAQAWMKINENNALYLFYYWLVDLICIALNKNTVLINLDQIETLQNVVKNTSVKDLFVLLSAVEKALIMKTQVNSSNDQLCFENLLIQYSQIVQSEVCDG